MCKGALLPSLPCKGDLLASPCVPCIHVPLLYILGIYVFLGIIDYRSVPVPIVPMTQCVSSKRIPFPYVSYHIRTWPVFEIRYSHFEL
jgi:hypothetical protein